MTVDHPRYLDEKTAAKILGFSRQSLANWRCLGRGPLYVKRGRSIRYLLSDLVDWMEQGRVDREVIG
jgi:predicted DNA-binding transcriptional regulator AlpA